MGFNPINRIGQSNIGTTPIQNPPKIQLLNEKEISSLLNEEVKVEKRNDFYRWKSDVPDEYIIDSYLNFIHVEFGPKCQYKFGHPLNEAFAYKGNSKTPINYDKKFHKKALCLYSELKNLRCIDKNTKDLFVVDKKPKTPGSELYSGVDWYMKSIVGDGRVFSGAEMSLIHEAIRNFKDDGEIISVMEESESLYADICKLQDKYAIRLADKNYAVASDKVTIALRDPSAEPAWATWFLNAVPLEKIPDIGKLLTLPEEDRQQYYPEPIPDAPIICHASLWKLGQQSGVLFSTSWNHISVNYRWKINKPIEIAAMLFRTVSHPAHLARNFNAAPQISLPGQEWF